MYDVYCLIFSTFCKSHRLRVPQYDRLFKFIIMDLPRDFLTVFCRNKIRIENNDIAQTM